VIVEVRSDGLTGTVALRYVEDGCIVAANDRIVDVECMKTLFSIVAPSSGIVRHCVELGQIVGQDDLIAVIEAGETS